MNYSSDQKEYNYSIQFGSNKWIAGASGDTTLVVFVPGHHYVTFHSPASSPGVLDQPVILALIGSIANDQNTMIKFCAAARPVKKEQMLLNSFGNPGITRWFQ